MPLQPCDGGDNTDEAAEVGDMLLLVDAMLENASADDKVQVCCSFCATPSGCCVNDTAVAHMSERVLQSLLIVFFPR